MHVCNQCDRPGPSSKATCLYCGGDLQEKNVVLHSIAQCPRCRAPMVTQQEGDIELDACNLCGGTWYDRGELEQHIARLQAQTSSAPTLSSLGRLATWRPDDSLYLPCGRCDKPMTRKHYGPKSGIMVDVCTPHGLFLNPGEVTQIKDYEGSDRSEKARVEVVENKRLNDAQRKRITQNKAEADASDWLDPSLWAGIFDW